MFHAMLIFADSFHRTGFFARNGDIYNRVIRTTLMADTATDASIMINHCLTVFLETYCILRAIHIAAACHTSPAKIGDFIINLYAGRTGFVNDTHDIFLTWFRAVQCHPCIFGERSYFVVFVRHIQSHQREGLVSPYSTFFMYAATSGMF